jgi:hypothetical protein
MRVGEIILRMCMGRAICLGPSGKADDR